YRDIQSFPTRRSSDLNGLLGEKYLKIVPGGGLNYLKRGDQIGNTQSTMEIEDLVSKFVTGGAGDSAAKKDSNGSSDAETVEFTRSEEHTSELQSRENL